MGKHSEVSEKVSQGNVIQVDPAEQEHLQSKLGRLSKKSIDVIAKAIVAKKACGFCLDDKPRRKNKDGKCAACNGAGEIDDFERNKWGAEQVLNRKLPIPKAVSMVLDDKRDKEKLAAAFRNMSKEKVLKLLGQMDRSLAAAERMDRTLLETVEEVTSEED